MSRMEELPTPNSGTFAIQETMSVGFMPMTDDGIVSPWLTKELERLFPFAPQRKYVSVLDTSLVEGMVISNSLEMVHTANEGD